MLIFRLWPGLRQQSWFISRKNFVTLCISIINTVSVVFQQAGRRWIFLWPFKILCFSKEWDNFNIIHKKTEVYTSLLGRVSICRIAHVSEWRFAVRLIWSVKIEERMLDTFDILNTWINLDTLDTLDTLNTLNTWDTVDTLNNLKPLPCLTFS